MLIEQLISSLKLIPHPEGGYYCETYRSAKTVGGLIGSKQRVTCTGIYFLLIAGNFSALHRIQSDEMWHFYKGAPTEIIEITRAGELIITVLGNELGLGQVPQYVVKAGHWFGSRVFGKGDFSLVGCTVSPGFEFADFEMGESEILKKKYPQHAKMIDALTRD
jgi:predicted cupin superfamily sugar epimerase